MITGQQLKVWYSVVILACKSAVCRVSSWYGFVAMPALEQIFILSNNLSRDMEILTPGPRLLPLRCAFHRVWLLSEVPAAPSPIKKLSLEKLALSISHLFLQVSFRKSHWISRGFGPSMLGLDKVTKTSQPQEAPDWQCLELLLILMTNSDH